MTLAHGKTWSCASQTTKPIELQGRREPRAPPGESPTARQIRPAVAREAILPAQPPARVQSGPTFGLGVRCARRRDRGYPDYNDHLDEAHLPFTTTQRPLLDWKGREIRPALVTSAAIPRCGTRRHSSQEEVIFHPAHVNGRPAARQGRWKTDCAPGPAVEHGASCVPLSPSAAWPAKSPPHHSESRFQALKRRDGFSDHEQVHRRRGWMSGSRCNDRPQKRLAGICLAMILERRFSA